ncbi:MULTISPECIES: NUDIX domain-containing protein [Nocardia]|uniref:NUDIX domain-containing protein n=1 Tax=Nocardia TaxID=1817 RepID=UPI00055E7CCB|nr:MULTISPECIES: NUDIX domain-containing protein [Nocardia]
MEQRYVRRSGRVILADADDRILLIAYRGTLDPLYWITPGGGIDAAESPAEAAARELGEETGLRVTAADLGPQVAVAAGHLEIPGWLSGIFREDYFFYRLPTAGTDLDTSGLLTYESTAIDEFRWWSVDELASTDQEVYPLGLAGLLADLLAGRIPPEPVTLPWRVRPGEAS